MSRITNAVFLGSKKFGLAILKSLYEANESVNWTILCPPDMHDLRTCLDEFSTFADDEDLNLRVADSPDMIAQYVKDHNPDVIVVCGYYRILPEALLDEVAHGVWGIHNSLLPKYRGGSPLVWQMINGEKVLGSSLFRFDKGVDDGPILTQVRVPDAADLTIKDAMDLIEEQWIEKIPLIWRDFCDGDLEPIEQNHPDATYCAQRQEIDGVIDWTLCAAQLDRFIRAQAAPYPRAYFEYEDKRIRVNGHEPDGRRVYGRCGQVYEVRKAYVAVCCGEDTVLRLTKLDVDGKEHSASDVLKSFTLRL